VARAVVEVQTGGGTAFFAVDDDAAVGPERVSRNGMLVARLDTSLTDALAAARPAAEAVIDVFKQLRPDEISVDFGLAIDAQAGAVFARAGVGAHFNISVKWIPPERTPPEHTAG
jgi:hypothetical protein